ncbi:hypothetical protein E3A20_16270, partial [Planctomyces bekefii]
AINRNADSWADHHSIDQAERSMALAF